MISRLVFFAVFITIIASVGAWSYGDTISISPLHFHRETFSDINAFSLDVYNNDDDNTVTAYLNKGDVKYYDEDKSFIDCEDVKKCDTGYVFLEDGTYTLFIVNDYYFISQVVTFEAHFWTIESEIVIIPLLVGLLATSCIILYCIYRACCRTRDTGKVSVVYDSKNRSFSPYTEVSGDEIKANENLVPVTIELTTL